MIIIFLAKLQQQLHLFTDRPESSVESCFRLIFDMFQINIQCKQILFSC
jgi:hypothetical protein